MRSITGYSNGKPIWTDHGPGYGGSSKIGGEMVRGTSGPAAPKPSPNKPAETQHCELAGKCHHARCTTIRAAEAQRLYYDGSNLSLEKVGELLGGRSHRSVRYLLSIAAANESAA